MLRWSEESIDGGYNFGLQLFTTSILHILVARAFDVDHAIFSTQSAERRPSLPIVLAVKQSSTGFYVCGALTSWKLAGDEKLLARHTTPEMGQA